MDWGGYCAWLVSIPALRRQMSRKSITNHKQGSLLSKAISYIGLIGKLRWEMHRPGMLRRRTNTNIGNYTCHITVSNTIKKHLT